MPGREPVRSRDSGEDLGQMAGFEGQRAARRLALELDAPESSEQRPERSRTALVDDGTGCPNSPRPGERAEDVTVGGNAGAHGSWTGRERSGPRP